MSLDDDQLQLINEGNEIRDDISLPPDGMVGFLFSLWLIRCNQKPWPSRFATPWKPAKKRCVVPAVLWCVGVDDGCVQVWVSVLSALKQNQIMAMSLKDRVE